MLHCYQIAYHFDHDLSIQYWRCVAENRKEAIQQLDRDVPGARLYDLPEIVQPWEKRP